MIQLHTAATASVSAGEATAVLTVAKATGTATITVVDVMYGETVTPVISSSTDARSHTITYAKTGDSSSTTAPAEVGTYTATVRYEATDLYEEATASTTFAINKANAVIIVADDKKSYDKKYGDNAFVLGGITTNVGNAHLTYTVTAGSDVVMVSSARVVTLLKTGNATIKVELPGTDNYNAADSQTITVTVANGVAPKTKPSSTMTVAYSIDKVSAVSLPTGWTWTASDKDKALTAGGSITVAAEYTAADKEYFEGGLTATVTITRNTKPSGGDSGDNNSGNSGNKDTGNDSNNSNSNSAGISNTAPIVPVLPVPSAPIIPVNPINDAPVLAPQIPVVDLRTQDMAVDPGKPFIEGHPDQDGWDVIKERLQDAISDKLLDLNSDGKVIVDMNGASVVPGDILTEIKGQDVTVVFDLGDGIKWTINGMDITGDNIGDIDFAVSVGTNAIPVDVVNNVTGERYSIQISLAHDGDFGFTATLSVDMDKKNAGLYANLFYYNTDTEELEFICADKISEDGTADLTFTHASDYTIVVDKEPMDGSAVQSEVLADTADAGSNVQGSGTQSRGSNEEAAEPVTDKDAWSPWWIIVICGVIIAIGLGGFYVIRKKNSTSNSETL